MLFYEVYKKYIKIFRYLFFGFLTTLLTLLTYYLLTMFFLDVHHPFELQLANIFSWIVGFLFAYITNRLFVFSSKNKLVRKEFIYFFLSRLLTLLLDIFIMYLFVTILKYNDKIMKLISQLLVIIFNYLLSKFFVFNKSDLEV